MPPPPQDDYIDISSLSTTPPPKELTMAEFESLQSNVQCLQSSMDYLQASQESFITIVLGRLDASDFVLRKIMSS